jgi:hypothetical protein
MDLTGVTTLLGYITSGTLTLTTQPTGAKPSDIITAVGGSVNATKKVVITATATESETSLTVPAGLDLTTKNDDALTNLATLVVSGKLTVDNASVTLENVTTLTVNGELDLSTDVGATLAAATSITVSGTLDLGANTAFAPTSNTPMITTTGTGVIQSATATPAVLQALLAKAGSTLNIEQGGAVTLSGAAATVKAGTTLTLTGSGAITTAADPAKLVVKGQVVAGDLVITGAGDETGITTSGAGVIVSAADGLTIGENGIITIPASASINLGGSNGITLGAGTYKATTADVLLKTVSTVPTLTFESGSDAVLLVGADVTEGGLLTVGSASAIVGVAANSVVFTANTEAAPLATKLLVDIAAGATITKSGGGDGGITLTNGKIVEKAEGTVLGVTGTTGLKLLGSDSSGAAAWKAGT